MLYPVELRAQRGPVYRSTFIARVGRGRGIRTLDIQLPKLALYQAELYPADNSVPARHAVDIARHELLSQMRIARRFANSS